MAGDEESERDHASGRDRHEEQQQQEIGRHGPAQIAAQSRAEDADGQREQKSVHQYEDQPPELATGDPAQEKRHGQHRKHRQQSVKPAHRSSDQLAQHHVEPLQISQKEQAERPLAFFHAQAVGCRTSSVSQAVEQHDPGKHFKDVTPGLCGGQAEGEHEDDGSHEDRRQGKAQPHPISGALPRCGAQLAFDYRQDGHPGEGRAPDMSVKGWPKSPLRPHTAVRHLITECRMAQTSN